MSIYVEEISGRPSPDVRVGLSGGFDKTVHLPASCFATAVGRNPGPGVQLARSRRTDMADVVPVPGERLDVALDCRGFWGACPGRKSVDSAESETIECNSPLTARVDLRVMGTGFDMASHPEALGHGGWLAGSARHPCPWRQVAMPSAWRDRRAQRAVGGGLIDQTG